MCPSDHHIKGGHYIVACTPTRDHGQDVDPSNFRTIQQMIMIVTPALKSD